MKFNTYFKYQKLLFFPAGLFIFNVSCQINPEKDNSKLPNIIFFLADDQNNETLGCYGHPIIQTPNIDRLAENGFRFTNAFVTNSICMASRASIMTGMHTRTNGVSYGGTPLDSVWVKYTYPLKMKEKGIRTGFIGKWHFQVEGDNKPNLWFDYWRPVSLNPYIKEMEDGSLRHEADLCGDYAIEFIRMQSEDKPFCLQVSFNSPHADDPYKPGIVSYPWPQSVDGMYEDVSIPEPRLSDPEIFNNLPEFLKKSLARGRYNWRHDTPEKHQEKMRGYFRMISGIDHVIGRVLSELEELGLSENTIVIYSADNGYFMGNRGFSDKWFHFEESLRVPLIIFDPRKQERSRGRIIEELSLNIDLPVTFLDWMNIDISEVYEGNSLLPLVNNNYSQWRQEFFCESLAPNPGIPKWEGIRTKNYKYARYFENNYEFFYDLKKDPDELKNFISDPGYTEVINELRDRCNYYINTFEQKAERYESQEVF